MKKNIFIFALAAVTTASLAFGYKQKMVAEEYRLLAIENEIKARESQMLAEEQRAIALANLAEAERHRQLAIKNQEVALSTR